MLLAEFHRRADGSGVRRTAYRIGGGRDEAYCLERDGGAWSVFFQERGMRSSERSHATREDALDDLWSRLDRDPTSRQAPGAGPRPRLSAPGRPAAPAPGRSSPGGRPRPRPPAAGR